MPVTEGLMQIGSFDLQLVDDAGDEIRSLCRPGANILITEIDMGDPSQVFPDKYACATKAIYNGIILERSYGAGAIAGCGLLGYLETEKGYAGDGLGHGFTSVSYPATISDIMAGWFDGTDQSNGLRAGTAHAPTLTGVESRDAVEFALPPFKGPLDQVMQLTGNEYRCLPTGFVDWGQATALFRSSPLVGVYPGHAGREIHTGYTLLDGAQVEVLETIRSYRTNGLAQTSSGSFATGTPTYGSVTRWYPAGDPWVLYNGSAASSDSDDPADADALANAIGVRHSEVEREITITVQEYCVPGLLVPGDWIGLYDPANRVFDLANAVDVEGGPIFFEDIRCVGYTWPIVRGMGVYVAHDTTLERITDFVQFENDPDGGVPATTLMIGEKQQPLVPSPYASLID